MKKLQDFSFDKSRYERTSQKKICGWSIFGKSCQIGPDENGNCQAQFECVPYKNGDRWSCTRPSNSGGRCKEGPTAEGVCRHKSARCVPLDSLRKKRGNLILWSVAFGIMALVFILTSPLNKALISPGELSIKHSLKENECVQCHVTDADSAGDWLFDAFAAVPVHQRNKKCQACHDLGFHDALPHSLDPVQIAAITEKTVSDDSSTLRLFEPDGINIEDTGKSEIACSSCHREHQGRNHDMTRLENSQCVSCHVNEHKHFASDHPQFSDYPYIRRQRIIFDHTGHINDYFEKDKLKVLAPKTCASCHELDDTGRYMQARSFEQSCMACHSKDVTGEKLESKGFPVINIPAIDLATLKSKKINIGKWPADLEDEELTATMMFLLSANEKLVPLLEMISKGDVELYDLSEKDGIVLEQVKLLAWEVKRILNEIITDGQAAFLNRIQQSGGINQREMSSGLAGKISLNLLSDVQKSWFPELKKEMQKFESGNFASTSSVETESLNGADISNEDWSKAGGWYAGDFSVYYRPGSHADEFIYSWLEMLTSKGDMTAIQRAAFKQLSYDKLPGQCMKCHSVDQFNNTFSINWQGYRFDPDVHKFTDFNHKSHFSILDESSCEECHVTNMQADFLSGYKDNDPQSFTSNWKSMDKSTCESCHTVAGAGDDCTLCHNYHVGKFEITLPISSIGKNDKLK